MGPAPARLLKRAEIEGQAPRIQRHPALLQDIAVLHRRRLPHEPAYVTIWLRNYQRDIPTRSEKVQTLATWDVVDPLDPKPSTVPRDAR